ncbi:hypothetical protein D3C76_789660 [compost metagenome]
MFTPHRVAFVVLQGIDKQGERVQWLAQVMAGHCQQPGLRLTQCLQLRILKDQLCRRRVNLRLQVLPTLQQRLRGTVETTLKPTDICLIVDFDLGQHALPQLVHGFGEYVNRLADRARHPPADATNHQQPSREQSKNQLILLAAYQLNGFLAVLQHHLALRGTQGIDHRDFHFQLLFAGIGVPGLRQHFS